MLIGREAERQRIERLVADAGAGGGGVLLLHGDPGIGKTTLLMHAREIASKRMTVLSARGVETESEIPFAGLWDLLSPILELRERLPEAQSMALGQALALESTGTPARFAVPAALLGLLGAAAEERPLLCLVDDVQWLDAPSVEAIVFAARRLQAEGIAMLLAARDGSGRDVDTAGLERLHVGALGTAESTELLHRTHGDRLAGNVAAGLVDQAAGNPLALVELPRSLTDDQLTGRVALPPVLPASMSLEAAFRAQLEGLPEETRTALLVAAAADGGEDLLHVRAAIASLGVSEQALDAAEAAQILAVDAGRVRFRHPLLRATAYHAAAPPDRRLAHRALADTADPGTPSRAWHMAAGISAADENVARDLEDAANDARRRGGHSAAARAFTRAADLTPERGERARRILEAAIDHVAAGELEQAESEAESGLPLADDPLLRTGLERIRAHVQIRSGRPAVGAEAMASAAELVREEIPALAAAMLFEASLGHLLTGTAEDVMRHAEDGKRLVEGIELLEGIADVLVAQALTAAGDPGRSAEVLAAHETMLVEMEPPPGVMEGFASGAHAAMWHERFDFSQRVLDRLCDAARSEGALARLAYPLCIRAQVGFRRGRWTGAYADAEEAMRASLETGQASALSYATQMLAEIEAGLGRFDDARRHAAESMRIALETESLVFGPYARAALGAVHAAEGRFEDAVAEYAQAREDLRTIGLPSPGDLFWTVELIDVHVRAGELDRAREELAVLEELVTPGHPAVHQAQLERSRGLLAEGDEAAAHFDAALLHHASSQTPFERARTELAIGERLRRAKQRAQARGPLRLALETFERLGARPWAERARNELRASGAASARETVSVADVLSPHELQVAMIVARGATNKEAAARLFVSSKTVEHHLGQIYKKLELRSRTELSALLSGQLDAEPA